MTVHEGVCTCPACCPDKWNANLIAQQRMQFPQPSATAQWGVQWTTEQRLEYALVRIDMLEAIIRAHVTLGNK